MPDSTYKIIELVGTSALSWEDAAKKCRGDSRQHPSRFKGRGGHQTGHDHRRWKGEKLQGTGQGLGSG